MDAEFVFRVGDFDILARWDGMYIYIHYKANPNSRGFLNTCISDCLFGCARSKINVCVSVIYRTIDMYIPQVCEHTSIRDGHLREELLRMFDAETMQIERWTDLGCRKV